jgi:hypothetical protein
VIRAGCRLRDDDDADPGTGADTVHDLPQSLTLVGIDCSAVNHEDCSVAILGTEKRLAQGR